MQDLILGNIFDFAGIDPPDMQREKEGIAALQDVELKVDHSVCIASTLPL